MMFLRNFFGKNVTDKDDDDENRAASDQQLISTKVISIDFEGLKRTEHDIIHELVKPILNATNLEETLSRVNFVRQRFYELGLFRNVQVSVGTDTKSEIQNDDEPINLSISFNVDETRRYAGGVYISGNHNDASGNLELRSPNLFGRG